MCCGCSIGIANDADERLRNGRGPQRDHAGSHRNQDALERDEPDEARRRTTERHPDPHVALALDAARQQQRRDVETGQQEHETDQAMPIAAAVASPRSSLFPAENMRNRAPRCAVGFRPLAREVAT